MRPTALASQHPSLPLLTQSDLQRPSAAKAIIGAAQVLLPTLESGKPLDARLLRAALTRSFAGTDAEGAWLWKHAYEAAEVAQVLFLRRYLPAMQVRAGSPVALLQQLAKLAALVPTHTRRSEESQHLQQFSTPLELAFAVHQAANPQRGELVLEPSAGTGLLAVFAQSAGARLHLNELADTRADILTELFGASCVTRCNGEFLHALLPAPIVPSLIIMNPPFSASPHVAGSLTGMDMRHLASALARLAPGGRLVAITSQRCAPDNPAHARDFERLRAIATLRVSIPIAGSLFRRHGTTMPTRLSVFDRLPGQPAADVLKPEVADANALLTAIAAHVPQRAALETSVAEIRPDLHNAQPVRSAPRAMQPPAAIVAPTECAPLAYTCVDLAPEPGQFSDALYEPYRPEVVHIAEAKPHPTKLVQSAAMASVRAPKPTYQPHVPPRLISEGLLSDAQLESLIYAGEAHAGFITGRWIVDDTLDTITQAADDSETAVRFRRGWFLGDGTGAGKGRQVAGIILDNWLKGRRRALWISKSDKLIEDAQRDWSALCQEKLLITPLDRFRPGTPIALTEGILFTTYATLRAASRNATTSRLQQILDWLGSDFDGVVVFDEAHAMANATGGASERGDKKPSQQGLAGLKLQHALPNARVVYVSATGATTVENLGYAQRLGLWGGDEFPFPTRQDFVSAILDGGVAAGEVLARDLKALGLYVSRSLSYDGIVVDILEHQLTPEQIRIYDAYAHAYQRIHANLDDALRATNITGETGGAHNKQAKAAARSAFESNKQRFFNHLITAMKMPSLMAAIEADITAGRAPIVQLVSTSEALMERRLAHIAPAQWNDLDVDVTPREYVLDYLAHSFPVFQHQLHTDADGTISSTPLVVDGRNVICPEALALRDDLLQQLAALPPVQAALDQLIHHFGHERVAEITGRARRIIRRRTGQGDMLQVQTRTANANLGDAQAFMDDVKPILVFSDAGGTGRSYHADLNALNQRPRVHYLLEPGWKADAAIQGLGRSNRTNQAHPPTFRPVATDVRGEKRFLSTIARRLDSLGAITRGQRQTGGQGLFRPTDNLESAYAFSALRQFYLRLARNQIACCGIEMFEAATGLSLRDADGTLREDLPRISTFLNRMLALPISLQNALFAAFEDLLAAQIDSAMAAGTYEVGLETIRAHRLRILKRTRITTHAASGAETLLLEVEREDRTAPLTLADALTLAAGQPEALLINSQSQRAAVKLPAPTLTLDDGSLEARFRLVRPMERQTLPAAAFAETTWRPTDRTTFAAAWEAEVKAVPEFVASRFHIATGLLLPIWKRMTFSNPRVYRFHTDAGERVIGRVVPEAALAQLGVDDNPALCRYTNKAH